MKAPRGRPASRGPLTWLSVVLVVYLTAPLAVFLVRSAGHPTAGFSVPGLFPALATSAEAATISAGLIALFGVPLAYWLAHSRSRLASVAGTLVQLPLALPPLMSGVVLLYVFGNNTLLGRASGGRLTESVTGIVLAQSFVASPFLVVAARSAFERVPPQLEDVGATAGWHRTGRFWHVALPVAGPGVRAGLLLAWLRAFGEYGATVMMSYYPMSLPVFTYVQFSAVGLPATQAPAIMSLLLASAVVGISRLHPARVLCLAPWRGARAPASTGTEGALSTDGPLRTGRAEVPVGFDLDTGAGAFRLCVSYQASSARLAIVGASGAGKSMTLRCLAGILPGRVSFGGRPVGDLAPEDRHVGYVPQGDSLLPHLNLQGNVCLGPHALPQTAGRWMAALGLTGLEDRLPAQLSGGQRQRAALARALSCGSEVVLLDEPFTGLDSPQRAALVRELRRLQLGAGLSSVLVTHDVEEAALLADEVVVISGGRVAQCGLLADVLRHPATAEVAGVLGLANLRAGWASSPTAVRLGPSPDAPEVGTPPHGLPPGTPVTWAVPPRRLEVRARPGPYVLQARVADVADLGSYLLARLALAPGVEVEAELAPGTQLASTACWVFVPPEDVLVWPTPPERDHDVPGPVRTGREPVARP